MNQRLWHRSSRPARTILRESGGFTLIETIVAVVLFGLVGTMVLSVLTLGISATDDLQQSSQSMQVARSQIESIKQQDYSESFAYAPVAVPDADFVITIGGSVIHPGILQQIDVTVEYADGSTELSAYKVNHFPPILADFPLSAPSPDCPVGKECVTYYLHNNPSPPTGSTTAQASLPMTTTSTPSFVRHDYDSDIDTNPGRSIDKNGTVNEASIAKYQNWRTPVLTSTITLDGDVTLQLWSASDGFQQARRGAVTAFLRDWDGATYTEIASAGVFDADWQAGFDDFTVRPLTFPGVSYALPAGNQLEVKIVVGSQTQTPDMWFMWDFVDFDSTLVVTTQP